MSCTHDKPCGCNQDELTTLPNPCDTTECIDGEPCAELIDCNCVKYSGPDLPNIGVSTGDSVCTLLQVVAALGGVPGLDGKGISDASYDSETGILTFTFTDDTTFSTGDLRGEPGTNGNPGAKGDKGDNGNNGNFIVVEVEPAGANCLNGGVAVLTKSGITGATLDVQYICNAPLYGAMRAQGTPIAITKVAQGYTTSNIFTNSTKMIMAEIYDEDSAYDPTTSIWTCPEDGIYNLDFFVHLTKEGGSGWWDGTGPAFLTAGIMTSNSNNLYASNTFTCTGTQKHMSVNGTALGMNINAGTQLILKVILCTPYNYTPVIGDVARMVIQKVKPTT